MVGEGIETCLAAMQATDHAAWAALSTSGLRSLDLPREVRNVIVLADGDDPGEAAAQACAWRWKREGRRVRIARPPRGMDFNDLLKAGVARIEEGRVMCTPDVADNGDPISAVINAADEVRDRWRISSRGPPPILGAAFVPEIIERLTALRQDDRAAFEALRAQLKKAGCRVTALDRTMAEQSGGPGGRDPTQADILLDLAQAADLFHAPNGTGFADIDINGHRETWAVRAKGFRRWLARSFFEATQGAPSSEALQSALNVIEAKAHFDAPERWSMFAWAKWTVASTSTSATKPGALWRSTPPAGG
jgi:hypothetical protein